MTSQDSRDVAIGRRIAALREGTGLTQAELARRLTLTQSMVSRIESGTRRLSLQQAAAMASVLGVSPADLVAPSDPFEDLGPYARRESASPGAYAPQPRDEAMLEARPSPTFDVLSSTGPARAPEYTPDATAAMATTRAPSSRVCDDEPDAGSVMPERALEPDEFGAVVADWFAVARRAPALLALAPGARSLGFSGPAGDATPDPARLARFWRHELGQGTDGPLPDLVPLLESVGLQVVVARLASDRPHGACALVAVPREFGEPRSARIPFVFVNNGHRPVALQRFALAHEFAHLALGHGEAYDERIDWSGRSRRETDANAFAEEFVAPAAAVAHWFETTGEADDRMDVGTIVRLANHFGVSFWVSRYRARAAGYLTSPTQLRQIDRELRDREWTTIPRQLLLGGQRDTLSVLTAEARAGELMGADDPRLLRIAPRGTRVPGPMRAAVLGLIEGDLADVSEAARWLRHSPASLQVQLEQAGMI